MRPSRPASGITLLQLLVVVFVLSVLGSLLVANIVSGRRRAIETRAQAALKQLVSIEGTWRGTDSDRNGYQDYWTADVAGFYALEDALGAQLRYVDPQIAAADVVPLLHYPRLPVYDSDLGYHVRAMIMDENWMPYVERGIPPVVATPATGKQGTNTCKFAFCAYLPGVWGTTRSQFIVNEDGVVYSAEATGACPVTTWPNANRPPTEPLPAPWRPAD